MVVYGSDVDQVKDILQSIAINNKDVLDNPDPGFDLENLPIPVLGLNYYFGYLNQRLAVGL